MPARAHFLSGTCTFFLGSEFYYNWVWVLGSGAGAGMSYSVFFFLWENSESTDPVNAHPWLSLSLAPSYLILASYLSTFDRTSLSAAEPGLQHQPDHCQPGMEPASRHGWPQRCHLQGYMQALQLGTWRVCSVWAQCGILPRTVRISGHLCDDPGPARPCQLHFRGGGCQWGVRPEPHTEAVCRS